MQVSRFPHAEREEYVQQMSLFSIPVQEKPIMRRVVLAVVGIAVLLGFVLSQAAVAADPPADRVVVMYFHRTNPCPTCQKMSSYTEEAVNAAFADQLKNGKVEYHYIDFQDEKNDALVKGYKVDRPTLIVAQVVGNKVQNQQNLKEMWTLVRDKDEFVDYVQKNVKGYLK
jgi:thiol-disulfide isomerase/thioredoxin